MLFSLSQRMQKTSQWPVFLWCLLLVIATLLVPLFLRGIYVGPDSLTYMRSAEVFFTANHSQASVQFPPLYSILISALTALDLSEIQAATFLNFLCFSSSIWVCSYLFMCTNVIGRNKAVLLSILLMSSYVIFISHQQMMTESLFILLVFINIAVLERYTRKPTYRLIVLASLVAALSALSRYAGIAVILSTILILLIYGPERTIKSWFKIALLWGLSSILFGLWLLRNNILYSTFTGREVVTHDRQFEGLLYYLDVFNQLYFPRMVPQDLRLWLFVAFIVLTVSMLLLVLSKGQRRDGSIEPIQKITLIITLVFLFQAGLMVVALYVDPFLPVQRRLLTPLYALLLLLNFVLLAYFSRKPNREVWLFVYAGLYLLLNASRLIGQEIKDDEYRYGYASKVYTESPLIVYMQSVEPDAVISSNGDDVMSWHLRRSIQALPKKIHPRTNRTNLAFNDELKSLYCQIRVSRGYLVFFNNIGWRDYLPSLDEIRQQYEFEVLETLPDGVVLIPKKIDNDTLCRTDQ